MQIKVFFFFNFRNIQTATLIRKRIISALIDKAGNSTAGEQPKAEMTEEEVAMLPEQESCVCMQSCAREGRNWQKGHLFAF